MNKYKVVEFKDVRTSRNSPHIITRYKIKQRYLGILWSFLCDSDSIFEANGDHLEFLTRKGAEIYIKELLKINQEVQK